MEVASAPDAEPPLAAWNPARGVLFSLGLAVAVIAILFSSFQGYWFYITTRIKDPVVEQLKEEGRHIDHLSPVEAIFWFRQEEREGLGEPNPPAWTEIDKQHESARWWGIAGVVVAGVGLLATAGAVMLKSKRGV